MKKQFCVYSFCTLLVCAFIAQTSPAVCQTNDKVLLTVAGEKVSSEDFLKVYKKNNIKEHDMSLEALEEYLSLYINFKLKVREAMELRMDTLSSFLDEIGGYRKQLAKPYMSDSSFASQLIREAYDRMVKVAKVSHIAIKLPVNASPKDSLAAYKKILDIRSEIIKGADFGTMAVKYSDDRTSRDQEATEMRPFIPGNKGLLGYVSAFDVNYELENAMFLTEVGGLSMPVRTNFGYHIIKVLEKFDNPGKLQVAHIMVRTESNMDKNDSIMARKKIFETYRRITSGQATFEEMAAEVSDDKRSGSKGGRLPEITNFNKIVPVFLETVFPMNEGDLSEPVLSPFGWHIIKLVKKEPYSTFEEEQVTVKKLVTRDNRSTLIEKSFITKLKTAYGFQVNDNTLKALVKSIDDRILEKKWTVDASSPVMSETLCSFAGTSVPALVFASYIEKNQQQVTAEKEFSIKRLLDKFTEDRLLAYEDSQLEKKHPEFGALMREYHDGILLFDLTDQKVWSKAIKDTAGLLAYYEEHKNEFMWTDRVEASLYTCKNEAAAKLALKEAKKQVKKGLTDDQVLAKVNETEKDNLVIERKKYARQDNALIDKIAWEPGISEKQSDGGKVKFAVIHAKLNPMPKTLNEAKGLITSDYQNYLEQQWIDELKGKYEIEVNEGILSSLAQ